MWNRRVSLIVAMVVAATTLQGAAVAVLWQLARPRLSPVTAVAATADTAIAQVVQAAGDSAAVAITPLLAVTTCEQAKLAQGHLYSRTADLYVDPGAEDALIGRIAAALPAVDRPVRDAALVAGPRPLTANLGQGVALRVERLGDGWVVATAKTDCRAGAAATGDPSTPAGPVPTPIPSVYDALGTSTAAWHVDTVACAVGQITTVSATSQATDRFNLPARLANAIPAGAHRIATPANRVLWRDGAVSMIIEGDDDDPLITVQRTTSC
jgi:hypothetical protein